MCTMISTQIEVAGCGKGAGGWFNVSQANVSYDHPFSAPLEHALNIDFVNQALGPGARVAVELSAESAKTASPITFIRTRSARTGLGLLIPSRFSFRPRSGGS